ncbi:MAG: DNA methyltransferase [bacterium]|nr:DNA methyltransferase [bacterium]
MKYFFILGTNPTLSLAELTTVINHGKFSLIQKDIAILECAEKIETSVINKIGGTIKIGSVREEIDSYAVKDILNSIANFAKPEKIETKFNFGISFYGKIKIHPVKSAPQLNPTKSVRSNSTGQEAGIPLRAELFHGVNLKVLGMKLKKLLKESEISSRWVISKEPTLSSVVVEQNKLITDRGVEIVIIQFNKKLYIGKTLAVQPFKDLSFRDYGRPARDSHSGMLPLKLAQIMINMSGARLNETILDPFCGSGTIVTEAMLMGYSNIIGADLSDRAITDTRTNIEWIKKNYELPITNLNLNNIDATQISKQIKPDSVDAIITEPYLGPQRGRFDVSKTINELERLYSRSLSEFNKILKPGGKIVMVWPVFCGQFKNIFLNPDLNDLKIINPIPENLQTNIFIKTTVRQTIIYGRELQKVWREIVVLEK